MHRDAALPATGAVMIERPLRSQKNREVVLLARKELCAVENNAVCLVQKMIAQGESLWVGQ
jgi:hypothetical protein